VLVERQEIILQLTMILLARWSDLSSLECTYTAVTEFISFGASRTYNKKYGQCCMMFCALRSSSSGTGSMKF